MNWRNLPFCLKLGQIWAEHNQIPQHVAIVVSILDALSQHLSDIITWRFLWSFSILLPILIIQSENKCSSIVKFLDFTSSYLNLSLVTIFTNLLEEMQTCFTFDTWNLMCQIVKVWQRFWMEIVVDGRNRIQRLLTQKTLPACFSIKCFLWVRISKERITMATKLVHGIVWRRMRHYYLIFWFFWRFSSRLFSFVSYRFHYTHCLF